MRTRRITGFGTYQVPEPKVNANEYALGGALVALGLIGWLVYAILDR